MVEDIERQNDITTYLQRMMERKRQREREREREREKENDDSVTRFGDISPTFKSLLQFFRFYFVFGKMLNLF